MSSEYGRKKHSGNEKQELFDTFVNHVIKTLKMVPYRGAREKAFDALTRKRTDKEQVKQAVFERWGKS